MKAAPSILNISKFCKNDISFVSPSYVNFCGEILKIFDRKKFTSTLGRHLNPHIIVMFWWYITSTLLKFHPRVENKTYKQVAVFEVLGIYCHNTGHFLQNIQELFICGSFFHCVIKSHMWRFTPLCDQVPYVKIFSIIRRSSIQQRFSPPYDNTQYFLNFHFSAFNSRLGAGSVAPALDTALSPPTPPPKCCNFSCHQFQGHFFLIFFQFFKLFFLGGGGL